MVMQHFHSSSIFKFYFPKSALRQNYLCVCLSHHKSQVSFLILANVSTAPSTLFINWAYWLRGILKHFPKRNVGDGKLRWVSG